MSNDDELAAAARVVVSYWRDWPQSRRDAVRDLSQFLAAAIEDLATVAEKSAPRADCGTCGRFMTVTKAGRLRHHNGDFYVGGWRQVCAGSGEPPQA